MEKKRSRITELTIHWIKHNKGKKCVAAKGAKVGYYHRAVKGGWRLYSTYKKLVFIGVASQFKGCSFLRHSDRKAPLTIYFTLCTFLQACLHNQDYISSSYQASNWSIVHSRLTSHEFHCTKCHKFFNFTTHFLFLQHLYIKRIYFFIT